MERVYKDVLELVGKTPLVEIVNMVAENKAETRILAKLEYLNPTGSVKDRAAKEMIESAENNGLLQPGDIIIEPTSGNTGIGLACVAAIKRYPLILTMPETMSVERRNILKAYGAQVVLTEGARGMEGAIDKAKDLAQELAKEGKRSYLPQQFDNPANAAAHQRTTGVEVWEDTDGKVDIFVAGVGTGGTITGVGRYLKEKNSEVEIVAVEPKDSPMLSEGRKGPHKIQGIGAGFVPAILDRQVIDEVIKVSNEDAFRTAKEVGRKEGFLVGISSGATLYAALKIAQAPENSGKTIVVLLADSADRYYSTPLFEK